ncbi:hypothetical protein CES86_4430 [Brucella lupini]|uniref:Uncharacterized protein n=1 Tax=Brucella lupini TaxID=255457 RepID=A0A256GD35_9HYPH|nr:hypothetical protein CES86_4430 [Brucella lupini]
MTHLQGRPLFLEPREIRTLATSARGARRSEQCLPTRYRFQATASPASAKFIATHRNVTNVSRSALRAAHHPGVADNTASDGEIRIQINEVALALRYPGPHLGQGQHVVARVQPHRCVEYRGQPLSHRIADPARRERWRVNQGGGLKVAVRRQPYADAPYLFPPDFEFGEHRFPARLRECEGVARAGGKIAGTAAGGQELSREVGHTHVEVCEVCKSNQDRARTSIQSKFARCPPASRDASFPVNDDLRFQELIHPVADETATQACHSLELRSVRRLAIPDEVENNAETVHVAN